MPSKRNILFVINPISGGKKKDSIPTLISKNLDLNIFNYELLWWKTIETLETNLNPKALLKWDIVVAVGGDGTVNLLASYIKNTPVSLGIIPMGSGNGFARSLNIPLKIDKAIQHLNKALPKKIDLGHINNHLFVNIAGLGFDAQISKAFASSKKRGLKSYVKAVFSHYKLSRNRTFKITNKEVKKTYNGFLLSIANGTQWGNNFFVAPKATLDDGILDVLITKKPRIWEIPALAHKFSKKHISPQIRSAKMNIQLDADIDFHVDGEYMGFASSFNIEVMQKSLLVLV